MERADRDEWAKRVQRWRRSGLGAREFAGREGLKASTLWWWSSRLGPEKAPPPSFVEVKVPEGEVLERSALELVVRGGVRVVVPVGFDEDTLRRLLQLLEGG